MSTATSLIRAIRDNPDDDTVRLVYADFVEEEGDTARGEFIRVQVALSRTPESDPARRSLEDREHELLAAHEAHLLGVSCDADGLAEWEFRRGFVHEIAATPTFMLNEGLAITDVMASEYRKRSEEEFEEEGLRWSPNRRAQRASLGGTTSKPQTVNFRWG